MSGFSMKRKRPQSIFTAQRTRIGSVSSLWNDLFDKPPASTTFNCP
jgi:hypothetical protein